MMEKGSSKLTYKDWTGNNEYLANSQGWTLSDAINSQNGSPQIQKLDDSDTFKTDTEAWIHVYNAFLAGDKIAKKALMILSRENPDEFVLVKTEGELFNSKNKIE